MLPILKNLEVRKNKNRGEGTGGKEGGKGGRSLISPTLIFLLTIPGSW